MRTNAENGEMKFTQNPVNFVLFKIKKIIIFFRNSQLFLMINGNQIRQGKRRKSLEGGLKLSGLNCVGVSLNGDIALLVIIVDLHIVKRSYVVNRSSLNILNFLIEFEPGRVELSFYFKIFSGKL